MMSHRVRRGLLVVSAGALVVALWAVAWRAGLFQHGDTKSLLHAVEAVRRVPLLPLLFVLSYAVLALVGVPATPLTLAGGVLFGFTSGVVLNWIGAVLAALLTFSATRALERGVAAPWLARVSASFHRLPNSEGTISLFLLRLLPVAPFFALNVGFALTAMSWRSYALATALGIIPVTVVYTLFAASLAAGAVASEAQAFRTAFASAAVIAAITVASRLIIKRTRQRS